MKFKPGQAIVFEPYGYEDVIDRIIGYKEVVHFLAYHSPAIGHCIVVKYNGTVVTMMHPEDFRAATEDEV